MSRANLHSALSAPAPPSNDSVFPPRDETRRTRVVLAAILVVGFALRLAWRVHKGSDDFWTNGYSFFYDLATSLATGRGFQNDGTWAMRMPLYPAFLAITTFFGKNYLWIVVPQALIGTATTACAFLLARDLFGAPVGLFAAAGTAFYPYHVVHDTALQDTCLFTFTAALATWLLLRSMRVEARVLWTITGLLLAFSILTRQTLVPYAVAAIPWIGVFGVGTRKVRRQRVAVLTLAAGIPVGCWIVRNYLILGSPVMTSEFGRQLWNGNNVNTFSHYPAESMDLSTAAAYGALTPAQDRELDSLSNNEIRQSRWFEHLALTYIREHPQETLCGALRKVAAAFSWRFNPARERFVQFVYLVSYGPISIMAILGAWGARRRWKEQGLVYLHFLVFALVTAVFFGHSSHRAFLDLFMIAFAAAFLERCGAWRHWKERIL